MARQDPGDISRADFLWSDLQAVTPSDTTTYDPPLLGLWVGGAGNVAVETYRGITVTFAAVAAGTRLPVLAKKVLATGTTATLILGGKP